MRQKLGRLLLADGRQHAQVRLDQLLLRLVAGPLEPVAVRRRHPWLAQVESPILHQQRGVSLGPPSLFCEMCLQPLLRRFPVDVCRSASNGLHESPQLVVCGQGLIDCGARPLADECIEHRVGDELGAHALSAAEGASPALGAGTLVVPLRQCDPDVGRRGEHPPPVNEDAPQDWEAEINVDLLFRGVLHGVFGCDPHQRSLRRAALAVGVRLGCRREHEPQLLPGHPQPRLACRAQVRSQPSQHALGRRVTVRVLEQERSAVRMGRIAHRTQDANHCYETPSLVMPHHSRTPRRCCPDGLAFRAGLGSYSTRTALDYRTHGASGSSPALMTLTPLGEYSTRQSPLTDSSAVAAAVSLVSANTTNLLLMLPLVPNRVGCCDQRKSLVVAGLCSCLAGFRHLHHHLRTATADGWRGPRRRPWRGVR